MYSLQGDTVLDPFAGTGTVALAAAASGRNSVALDIEAGLVAEHEAAGKTLAHSNARYGFPVKTAQERELVVPVVAGIGSEGEGWFRAEYTAAD